MLLAFQYGIDRVPQGLLRYSVNVIILNSKVIKGTSEAEMPAIHRKI